VPPDVQGVRGFAGSPDAFKAALVGIVAEVGQKAELLTPTIPLGEQFDGEAEGEVHAPDGGGGIEDETNQVSKSRFPLGRAGENFEAIHGVENEPPLLDNTSGDPRIPPGEFCPTEIDAEVSGDRWRPHPGLVGTGSGRGEAVTSES
jgi:hypothetical protein